MRFLTEGLRVRLRGLFGLTDRLRQPRLVLPAGGKPIRLNGRAMGTVYHITACRPPVGVTAECVSALVHETLQRIEQKMSAYRPDSELNRFNKHPVDVPFLASEETAEVFDIARQVNEETSGAFDITIAPLVNLWGFGPEKVNAFPSDGEIAEALSQTGCHWLEAHADNTLIKRMSGLQCNLSAVAKGYGVDKVAEALERIGISHFLVEVGGEVRAHGINLDGNNWRLAIEEPTEEGGERQLVASLSGASLATSGDYRIYRVQDGARHSHEIDPRTGRPVNSSIASVSVIHPSCAWADAYATGLMVLGPDEGFAFAAEHRLAACFLLREPDGKISARQTGEFEKYVCLD